MSGVQCYNECCGDDGRCGIADYDLRMCLATVEEARAAGIPLCVIMGNAKLNASPPEGSEQYRRDMIDAGRGHLVRP